MSITATDVKKLRDAVGAPMMDCKKALAETAGDMDKAVEWLRKKGIAKADKRSGREATEGRVWSYIHHNGRVGVLLEVNCETDFVANTDQFQDFCKEVALHIASMNPTYLSREEVPAEALEKEKAILMEQLDQSKPAEIREKIVEGRISKFYGDICLLEQPWVKDDKKTIDTYRAEIAGGLGENVVISRFARYSIGG